MLRCPSVEAIGPNEFLCCIGFSGRDQRQPKTVKHRKRHGDAARQLELAKRACDTLGSGNLRQAVMLPDGEDEKEWIAVNSKTAYKDPNFSSNSFRFNFSQHFDPLGGS